ncbi:MAG: branched-chain amino acid ABC transporter permease [Chloroflexi bacterium]|nr:branched-chain amino acid ABC transporter permease [Chloroflexota bacterium]
MKPISSVRFRQIISALSALLLIALIFWLGGRKNFGLQQYGQLVIDGLRGGTIYALIALGLVTIYNVTGVINFAQGAFVMLGAMVTADLFAREFLPFSPGLNLVAAAILAILFTTAVGVVMERLVIYPVRDASPLTLIIITVGVYIVIQGLALIHWGSGALKIPAFATFFSESTRDTVYRPFGIIIKAQSLWIWATTAVVLIVLYWFFNRTIYGKAFQASAINRTAARLMGISPNKMSLLAFAIAAAVGAIAGIVLGPVTSPTYDMGLKLGLKGFVAAIVGGLVSAPAAVIGGLLLGVVENVAAGVTKSGLKDIFAFIILILVLLYRPQGILTKTKETEKV